MLRESKGRSSSYNCSCREYPAAGALEADVGCSFPTKRPCFLVNVTGSAFGDSTFSDVFLTRKAPFNVTVLISDLFRSHRLIRIRADL